MAKKKKIINRNEVISKVQEYIDFARSKFDKDKELANKYVKKARRLQMKHKIRLPRELKRRFCKHCYNLFVAGKSLRVRTREGHVVYYCLECKKYMRFPYTKRKKWKS
ncbi:MAG: ribonuclease P [Candidatus Woesearchaeota archaeon]